jgi:8-oxo-dGTP pyrophosphatase MutT (NUDIX family)
MTAPPPNHLVPAHALANASKAGLEIIGARCRRRWHDRAMAACPAPAATIVLLRDAAAGLEVYLVKRPAGASFMAGAHVFPGGRVEATDRDPTRLARCEGAAILRARFTPDPPPEPDLQIEPYGLAALRELFEEAGILLARRPSGSVPDEEALLAWREARGGRTDEAHDIWQRLLVALDARPALDALVVMARWITPEAERRRFDTWFFAARCPEGQSPQPDGHEAVEGIWLQPGDAVARHQDGRLRLAPPTLRTLEDLASRPAATSRQITHELARSRPPTILPHVLEEAGRRWLLLPGDPRYPGSPVVVPSPRPFLFDGERWQSAR